VTGGAQRRNGGTATESDQVLQEGVAAQAQFLGDIAGESGAEIAGAGANQQGVELCAADAGGFKRGGDGPVRRPGSLGSEMPVQGGGIGVLGDRREHKGIEVPFFGRMAPSTST